MMIDDIFSQKNTSLFSDEEKRDACKIVLDNAHVGVFVCDPDGIIRYMNQMFAEMFEINKKTALGRKVTDYFEDSVLLQVMKTGEPHRGVKFSWKGRDALVYRTPIKREGKVICGVVEVIFRDISELKEMMRKMDLLEQKVDYYKRKTKGLPSSKYSFKDIIGKSRCVQALKQRANKFAKSSQPVLILGESGTGKELLAHAIHCASPRASEVFVSISCAAIPKDLLESELFGYEEGAFTGARKRGRIGKFELADKGTIFLDEIGELPGEMQAKLLRVIEHKEIEKIGKSISIHSDFRLISSTNQNLEASVAKATFREDLYHRLSILVLKTPPLRERTDDLPDLTQFLLDSLEDKPIGLEIKLSRDVKELFQAHSWSGNIRELKNVITFSFLSLENEETKIELRHLPQYIIKNSIMKSKKSASNVSSLKQVRESSEKDAILAALDITKKNKAQASRILGISRNELYKKLRRHGLL